MNTRISEEKNKGYDFRDTYENYSEWKLDLEEAERKVCPLAVSRSKSMEAYNKSKLSQSLWTLPEGWQECTWKKKTFNCVHGAPRKSKGTGIRARASMKEWKCPYEVSFTVCKGDDGGCYMKTVIQGDDKLWHNHPVGPNFGSLYPRIRKANVDEKTVKKLLLYGAAPRKVREFARVQTGFSLTRTDLSNYRYQAMAQERMDEALFSCTKDFMSRREGNDCRGEWDKEGTVQQLTIQSAIQKDWFTRYGSVLNLDATYNTNVSKYCLMGLGATTDNGKGELVFSSVMRGTTSIALERMFSLFKERNENWEQIIKVIVVDKDFNEIQVVEKMFPKAQVILCVFHVLAYIKKEVRKSKYALGKEDAEFVDSMFRFMAFARSRKKYMDMYEGMKKRCTDTWWGYFIKNWHRCRDRWAGPWVNTYPHLGNRTNNRLERKWRDVKADDEIHAQTPIVRFINRLFNYMSERDAAYIEACTKHRLVILPQRSYHSALHNILYHASPYALRIMDKLFKAYETGFWTLNVERSCEASQHMRTVTVSRLSRRKRKTEEEQHEGPDEEELDELDMDDEEECKTYQVDINTGSCTCTFHRTRLLPCYHLVECLKPGLLSAKMIPERWVANQTLYATEEVQEEQKYEAPSPKSIFRIHPEYRHKVHVDKKIMSMEEKFNFIQQITRDVASKISGLGGASFEQAASNLQTILSIFNENMADLAAFQKEVDKRCNRAMHGDVTDNLAVPPEPRFTTARVLGRPKGRRSSPTKRKRFTTDMNNCDLSKFRRSKFRKTQQPGRKKLDRKEEKKKLNDRLHAHWKEVHGQCTSVNGILDDIKSYMPLHRSWTQLHRLKVKNVENPATKRIRLVRKQYKNVVHDSRELLDEQVVERLLKKYRATNDHSKAVTLEGVGGFSPKLLQVMQSLWSYRVATENLEQWREWMLSKGTEIDKMDKDFKACFGFEHTAESWRSIVQERGLQKRNRVSSSIVPDMLSLWPQKLTTTTAMHSCIRLFQQLYRDKLSFRFADVDEHWLMTMNEKERVTHLEQQLDVGPETTSADLPHYLIVYIQSNSHYSCVIWDTGLRQFVIYDSISAETPACMLAQHVVNHLLLCDQLTPIKSSGLYDKLVRHTPRQQHGTSCGVYVLAFIAMHIFNDSVGKITEFKFDIDFAAFMLTTHLLVQHTQHTTLESASKDNTIKAREVQARPEDDDVKKDHHDDEHDNHRSRHDGDDADEQNDADELELPWLFPEGLKQYVHRTTTKRTVQLQSCEKHPTHISPYLLSQFDNGNDLSSDAKKDLVDLWMQMVPVQTFADSMYLSSRFTDAPWSVSLTEQTRIFMPIEFQNNWILILINASSHSITLYKASEGAALQADFDVLLSAIQNFMVEQHNMTDDEQTWTTSFNAHTTEIDLEHTLVWMLATLLAISLGQANLHFEREDLIHFRRQIVFDLVFKERPTIPGTCVQKMSSLRQAITTNFCSALFPRGSLHLDDTLTIDNKPHKIINCAPVTHIALPNTVTEPVPVPFTLQPERQICVGDDTCIEQYYWSYGKHYPKENTVLQAGDMIRYYARPYRAGDPRGLRKTTILEVDREASTQPLKLQTSDILRTCDRLQKVKHGQTGCMVLYNDTLTPLSSFELITSKIDHPSDQQTLGKAIMEGKIKAFASFNKTTDNSMAQDLQKEGLEIDIADDALDAIFKGELSDVLITKFSTSILRKHIMCLQFNHDQIFFWLNDEVINFWMQMLVLLQEREGNKHKYHIFNTFFYTAMMGGGPDNKTKTPYQRVQRWTNKLGDLFSFDKILVPINFCNVSNHCPPHTPAIKVTLDPLGFGCNRYDKQNPHLLRFLVSNEGSH